MAGWAASAYVHGWGAVNRRRGWQWQWGRNGKVGMGVVEQSEKIVRNDERHVMRTRKMGRGDKRVERAFLAGGQAATRIYALSGPMG